MTLTIYPSEICGTVRAPPSKSATHREFILSALAEGTSVITRPLISADTIATLDGIRALGAEVGCSSERVEITGGNLHHGQEIIDCRNSGTTLRMLVAVAACLEGTTRFTGDASLLSRPMDPLFDALRTCGAIITTEDGVIAVTGPIVPGYVDIQGNISSQFISALLIAGCSVHVTTSLVSAPYAAMTVSALQRRGCTVTVSGENYLIISRTIAPASVIMEGDWSSAAYLLAAGALAGSVTVTGLSPIALQGDRDMVSILEKMGASVIKSGDSVTVAASPLQAVECSLEATPDLFPVVAVLAANAAGTSRLYGVAHLIYKESNRLQGTADMLAALGISITLDPDGCSIVGGKLQGASLSVAGDHRLFMAAVVAGLVAHGSTEIRDVGKGADVSYPAFVHDIRELGGLVR